MKALALLENKPSAKSRPIPLKAVPTMPILTKNKYKIAITALTLIMVFNWLFDSCVTIWEFFTNK
jgi:hypothetical protein